MDPWLEGYLWADLHHELASSIRKQLAPQVKPKYVVRIDTYTYQNVLPEEEVGIFYPDLEILKKYSPPPGDLLSEPEAVYGTVTPPTLTFPTRLTVEARVPVVEIRDKGNNQLITAIEILSPVNKRNPGIVQYREKREMLCASGVHLLEIDLLRKGQHPAPYSALPKWAHYFAVLVRADHTKTQVWALTVRDKLPTLPVPLKSPDPDIRLDLSKALDDAVNLGDYSESVNYREEPPLPAFSEEDREWLQGILRDKKLIL
jgi:hypothetical protein